jgi:hypothetical protein
MSMQLAGRTRCSIQSAECTRTESSLRRSVHVMSILVMNRQGIGRQAKCVANAALKNAIQVRSFSTRRGESVACVHLYGEGQRSGPTIARGADI